MKAAVFRGVTSKTAAHLSIEDVERSLVRLGYVLLRLLVCGVCRTDLPIVEGDLPVIQQRLIPGHQIVGKWLSAPARRA